MALSLSSVDFPSAISDLLSLSIEFFISGSISFYSKNFVYLNSFIKVKYI